MLFSQNENTSIEVDHEQMRRDKEENMDPKNSNDEEEARRTAALIEEPSPITPSQTPGRTRRKLAWLDDCVITTTMYVDDEPHNLVVFSFAEDPNTYEEAVKKSVWRNVMDKEIEAIERNETWELTTLSTGAKKIGVKWIYKTKYNENGEIDKHKAKLVAKGYSRHMESTIVKYLP